MNAETARPRLLFVSVRFLFPADTGGQIRTTQVLRGMKGSVFDITLVSPAPDDAERQYRDDLDRVCDRFAGWPRQRRGPLFGISRLRYYFSRLPIPVRTDWSAVAARLVARELESRPDVVVFDFPHAAILTADKPPVPSVMFTHNVEAEIFRRHVQVAGDPLRRHVWASQYRKMVAWEQKVLNMFDAVVAVSARDGRMLSEEYGLEHVDVIPTGVDLDYFTHSMPLDGRHVVFTGSMDWLANIDGIAYFMDQVWPHIAQAEQDARMTVVGRNPPPHLVGAAQGLNWEFTGFVDDIRPHIRNAGICVIPLRVGGGTRLKVFEAMASGCAVVSTKIGVEGLPLADSEHYLRADSVEEMANAVTRLMRDDDLRNRLSLNARRYVEENFSYTRAASEFEKVCVRVMAEGPGAGHSESGGEMK